MPRSIGIRELRDSLSAVLRELKPGTVIDVTDRGQVVAHLMGATPERPRSRWQQMVDSGEITRPSARAGYFPAWPKLKGGPLPPGTAQRWIDEDRGD